jgi:hypothetical protein
MLQSQGALPETIWACWTRIRLGTLEGGSCCLVRNSLPHLGLLNVEDTEVRMVYRGTRSSRASKPATDNSIPADVYGNEGGIVDVNHETSPERITVLRRA